MAYSVYIFSNFFVWVLLLGYFIHFLLLICFKVYLFFIKAKRLGKSEKIDIIPISISGKLTNI